MFNRILVPLDGSTLAERALPHARLFAKIFGSTIFLLQVLDPSAYHDNPNSVDPLSWQIHKAEADLYLRGIATKLQEDLKIFNKDTQNEDQDDKKVTVEYSIREGKTAENIVNFAHVENIDLLIISTHGSGGLSRWNVSSVTQKVIDMIYLPVLIVRAYNHPATEGAEICYSRILLPIDSSRRAESALSAGIVLAQGETKFQSVSKKTLPGTADSATELTSVAQEPKLYLAAVISPPEIPIPAPYPAEIRKLSDQLLQVSRKAVRAYLDGMKLHLPVECEIRVVESSNITTAVQDLADQENIDLVLMSAHGYTGQSTWPYGSVARNFIEHGTKPVLIIQDVSRTHVQPTAAAIAAEKSGGR